ncbi:HAMP domain-containing histidine kinase [Marinobacter salinexigens]|uniref:histidine kinase n=1 Tax=Marinobacter salinexigens TaxID=2919747 RepID=A0A5B0VNL5_9GAMM|nr:HAMP domain-containing sensor histidine kinase [Marinobacter salinexigens]KAA1176147.1 HAMP domain-containing histidine kinase [Marinobacter salinexigens]
MNIWPQRAGGQLALLLIVVLLVAQGITIGILAGERQGALRSASQEHVLERFADAYTLLDTADPERQSRILRALSTPTMRLTIDTSPALTSDGAPPITDQLQSQLSLSRDQLRTSVENDNLACLQNHDSDHDEDDEHDKHEDREDHHERNEEHEQRECPPVLKASLALSSGQWFNASAQPSAPSWLWLKATLSSVGITAVLLTLTILLAIRRILRPVNELSSAAHAFARGEKVHIEERGPEDIREVTRAFNQMQNQVSAAQKDRERLLAALAHDLRTPITSMRLRVELLPDGEDKERLLSALEEMQTLSEATLDFIRGSTTEQYRRYDIATLLDSLCSDLQDIGMAVEYRESPRCVLQGQPQAVKRALRNLVENGVTYGRRVEVRLSTDAGNATVEIIDRGPGIPESEREKVFEPFYRLEQSRSRETGGAGLGLAIARTLIRGMGGDIRLNTGPDGLGLKVSVTLPRPGTDEDSSVRQSGT